MAIVVQLKEQILWTKDQFQKKDLVMVSTII